jgi:CDP-diglyceride synthetase
MIKLVVNLALPALGIVVAALTQLALTTLWPGIQAIPFAVVSLDSYVVVFLALGLCFLAGRRAHYNLPTIAGSAAAVIVPLVWLGLILKGILMLGGSIAWFQSLTIFTLFSASAPLIGVVLGWHSSSMLRRVQQGV